VSRRVRDQQKGVETILTKQEALQALNNIRRQVALVRTELGDDESSEAAGDKAAEEEGDETAAELQDEILSDNDSDDDAAKNSKSKAKAQAGAPEKLTRAQRNKIKRKKDQEIELVAHRARKQMRKGACVCVSLWSFAFDQQGTWLFSSCCWSTQQPMDTCDIAT
jgi:hypothetical protein